MSFADPLGPAERTLVPAEVDAQMLPAPALPSPTNHQPSPSPMGPLEHCSPLAPASHNPKSPATPAGFADSSLITCCSVGTACAAGTNSNTANTITTEVRILTARTPPDPHTRCRRRPARGPDPPP